MNKTDSIHTALDFLRELYRSFRNTTIDCTLDEFVENNKLTCGLCNLDNIKRNHFFNLEIADVYTAALACSDYDIPHEDLNKDLCFLFQLANEVLCIILTVTNSNSEDTQSLKEVIEGLREIVNSISFGNPASPTESGAGIAMSVFDILMHRTTYHALYKGYTNSTPLAKYFVIINTLNRRTSCSIIVK